MRYEVSMASDEKKCMTFRSCTLQVGMHLAALQIISALRKHHKDNGN